MFSEMETMTDSSGDSVKFVGSTLTACDTDSNSYTGIMMKRWEKHVQKCLGEADADDAQRDEPCADSGQPEYAHSNYLRLRQIDESRRIYNYLDPKLNE